MAFSDLVIASWSKLWSKRQSPDDKQVPYKKIVYFTTGNYVSFVYFLHVSVILLGWGTEIHHWRIGVELWNERREKITNKNQRFLSFASHGSELNAKVDKWSYNNVIKKIFLFYWIFFVGQWMFHKRDDVLSDLGSGPQEIITISEKCNIHFLIVMKCFCQSIW